MPYCSVCGKRIPPGRVVSGAKNIVCSKECMYAIQPQEVIDMAQKLLKSQNLILRNENSDPE